MRRRAAAVGVLVILAAALLPLHAKASPPTDFVYRNGSQLMLNGNAYRFKGLNMYWANSRWGTTTPTASNNTIQPTNAGEACNVDGGTFNDLSLQLIGNAGNASRAWFFQAFVTVNGARNWAAFDSTLATYKAHNVKVIVTLGASGACDGLGPAEDDAWYTGGYRTAVQATYLQTYRDYVHDVVTRYAGHSEILMWQLMNEANDYNCTSESEGAAALRSFADDMAGVIKSVDANHLVSLGTGLQGGCGYDLGATTSGMNDYKYVHAGPNVDLCEYHDYNVETTPIFALLQEELTACTELGKPFFVGELGLTIEPARAALLKLKLDAQFGAGSQGELVWGWCMAFCDQYSVYPGDPMLTVLSLY